MPFNTLTVGAAVTPGVIETYFSHYLNRKPLRQKPTAHISYHEGLQLVRHFLEYASRHTVEDIQGFTAQYVPSPHWIRVEDFEITSVYLERSARLLHDHLGESGLERVGGKTWWQWRRPDSVLRAEWIEMKKDFHARKAAGVKCDRVMLYIHGGAYYFGSVDEHRYQMQRHARKLKARVLAPRYRLAPQFPFPCGLHDCIASYLFLLDHFDPSNIIIAGDSAGGGMALSMLCVLRDQNQPLPAGSILLSPWVDLTHSFPSVAGDSAMDYIPPWGFVHRPSMAWPPNVEDDASNTASTPQSGNLGSDGYHAGIRRSAPDLTVELDGKTVQLREQIQMYAPNTLLAHPLVSPVMQPSLGGLPPMLIQTGGGEMLRDEQIYIAHKAANPTAYPPSDAIFDRFGIDRQALREYPPTYVQLQVWDDLCHVAHTLSFTRPAKYMYRSVAQFGAWALAHAQQKGIDIQNDDAVSVISSDDDEGEAAHDDAASSATDLKADRHADLPRPKVESVGKAGDPLPLFKDHMIRQRVTRHGVIYPLAPASDIPCLSLDPESVGAVKPGPVRKWLAAKQAHDAKFAGEWKKVLAKREQERQAGYEEHPGEHPPPSALAGRRRTGMASEEKKKSKSWGLALWSGWGSSHDEHTLEREEKKESDATTAGKSAGDSGRENGGGSEADGVQHTLVVPADDDRGRDGRRTSSSSRLPWSRPKQSSRSPYLQVNDQGQADAAAASAAVVGAAALSAEADGTKNPSHPPADADAPPAIPTMAVVSPESEPIPDTEHTFLSPSSSRPHNGTVAYPFKLRSEGRSASNTTLDSVARLPGTGALRADDGAQVNPPAADASSRLGAADETTPGAMGNLAGDGSPA